MAKSHTYYRNKADKLLQEYIRVRYQWCMVCSKPLYAGHHFFTKASSNALRYYIPNIIPICRNCHCLVHKQPHLINPKICFIKGQGWYDDLLAKKREKIKANKEWYKSKVDELTKLKQELTEEAR